ncbi:hypothetical protein GGX14DRAFT_579764 [Mycena pura]|uniref:Uncharacterized protein n=1 Tax=Mycena pura TaxID=153505 RepID=A0AAD6UUC9_9AGAR|nr:hypothetical protein GGX14DRAFT_579764 [Mycena pura]
MTRYDWIPALGGSIITQWTVVTFVNTDFAAGARGDAQVPRCPAVPLPFIVPVVLRGLVLERRGPARAAALLNANDTTVYGQNPEQGPHLLCVTPLLPTPRLAPPRNLAAAAVVHPDARYVVASNGTAILKRTLPLAERELAFWATNC